MRNRNIRTENVDPYNNDDDEEYNMNEQQQQQEKKMVEIPMYDEPLLEAQQDEREMREIFQRQQRWSNYPI